jgi:hypothetical protein
MLNLTTDGAQNQHFADAFSSLSEQASLFLTMPERQKARNQRQVSVENFCRQQQHDEKISSSRCLESAQSHRARVRTLATRASDTALRRNRELAGKM